MKARTYLGTQGWNYEGWVGPFYPRGSKPKELLSLYGRIFDTVEVDSTFYAIPSENSIKGWAERTPKDFKFSLKLPSEITHKNRLRESQEVFELFMQRVNLLGEKLGCVLIQLPPDFSPREYPAFSSFINLLPSTGHFAVEFRDANWLTDQTISLLANRNIALALTDSRWINRRLSFGLIENYTTDFAYVRWLGLRDLTDYSHIQIDRSRELAEWAEAFAVLQNKTKQLYGYFNNHFQGHSPESCNQFKTLLGLPVTRPDSLVKQPSLFS
ncbi:MAG TPA: DUF72 domain-containing protein [Blastocatellia bacterium]|nr:DUF72 domain-containing protein [Blastocatellia bacterium]